MYIHIEEDVWFRCVLILEKSNERQLRRKKNRDLGRQQFVGRWIRVQKRQLAILWIVLGWTKQMFRV
ncbi:unnamed protein product [Paramecium sonneborni]|uniref:Uncharacterized protein n=1 Tax=Paramecium sonneborni TaxID=65129 RepID=A0A8S1N934_9CILI|nr:unnamed protein product [Paramecium sonneborni]